MSIGERMEQGQQGHMELFVGTDIRNANGTSSWRHYSKLFTLFLKKCMETKKKFGIPLCRNMYIADSGP